MWLELEVSNYIVHLIVKDIKGVVLHRFIAYSRNGELEMKSNIQYIEEDMIVKASNSENSFHKKREKKIFIEFAIS